MGGEGKVAFVGAPLRWGGSGGPCDGRRGESFPSARGGALGSALHWALKSPGELDNASS